MTGHQSTRIRSVVAALGLGVLAAWGVGLVVRGIDGSTSEPFVRWVLLAAGVIAVVGSAWALIAAAGGRLAFRWMATRINESAAISHQTLPHLSANPDEFAPIHRPRRPGG